MGNVGTMPPNFELEDCDNIGRVNAKIGVLSCVGLLAFSVGREDAARVQEWIARGR